MKSTKQNERKREGRGEEGKKSWGKVFIKRKYRVGTEPSALVYIG